MSEPTKLPGACYQCYLGESLLGLPDWFAIVDERDRIWACRKLRYERGQTFEPDDYSQIEARHKERGVELTEEVSFWSESIAELPTTLASFLAD